MKIYIHTLGCKVNQYESECIEEAWRAKGAIFVSSALEADSIVVNSCAVTENAIKDSKKLLALLQKNNYKGNVILTGCATKLIIPEETEGICYSIVPQKEKHTLLRYIEKILPHSIQDTNNVGSKEKHDAEPENAMDMDVFSLSSSARARATVKVHDGCSHNCTYCIIPHTRGASKSRAIADIFHEIRMLLENGHKELILSGINLRQFGRDFTFPIDFWDLVQKIEREFAGEWRGEARFRISSIEPCQLNDKAVDILSKSTLICPHLHISLQSASNTVLKAMARGHYNATMLTQGIERLSTLWDTFALGVDIITGFPGENEEDFLLTQQFLQEIPLTYAHIFPFSERPFTKAPSLPNQVYPHIRKERAKILRAIANDKKENFIKMLIEKKIPQHIVREKHTHTVGVSEYYIECENTKPFTENIQPYIAVDYMGSKVRVE